MLWGKEQTASEKVDGSVTVCGEENPCCPHGGEGVSQPEAGHACLAVGPVQAFAKAAERPDGTICRRN